MSQRVLESCNWGGGGENVSNMSPCDERRQNAREEEFFLNGREKKEISTYKSQRLWVRNQAGATWKQTKSIHEHPRDVERALVTGDF